MTEQHPITPPPEMVQQLQDVALFGGDNQQSYELSLITAAFRAGADRELDACAEWLVLNGWGQAVNGLRAARRPKPPSLREQALGALYAIATGADDTREFHQDLETIKAALESLPS